MTALYLCRAEAAGRDFITADERLCARAQGYDLSARVLSLAGALDALGIRGDHPPR
jgi:hypothetical protein